MAYAHQLVDIKLLILDFVYSVKVYFGHGLYPTWSSSKKKTKCNFFVFVRLVLTIFYHSQSKKNRIIIIIEKPTASSRE